MNRCFSAIVFLIILVSNQVQAEELHLICTGQKLISVDNDAAWSNEIIVDLQSAEIIKFETSWTLAAQNAKYAIEAFAEIDDSTIKIFDRAVGAEGQWRDYSKTSIYVQSPSRWSPDLSESPISTASAFATDSNTPSLCDSGCDDAIHA